MAICGGRQPEGREAVAVAGPCLAAWPLCVSLSRRRKISAGRASRSSTRRENSRGPRRLAGSRGQIPQIPACLRLERHNKKKRNADVEAYRFECGTEGTDHKQNARKSCSSCLLCHSKSAGLGRIWLHAKGHGHLLR